MKGNLPNLDSQKQQTVEFALSQTAIGCIDAEARRQGISASEVMERLVVQSWFKPPDSKRDEQPQRETRVVNQHCNQLTEQLHGAQQQIRQQQQVLEQLQIAQNLQEQIEQEALKTQAELLALLDMLFAAAPVAMGFLDTELRFIRINSMLAVLNGLPCEAHIGQKFNELFPEMAAQFAPIMEKVLSTGEPVLNLEISGVPPGKTELGYWLGNYYPVRDGKGHTLGVGLVLADITETKRAELATREANRKVALILESITDAFLSIDRDWRYVYANAEAQRLLNKSKQELIGHSVWQVFPELVGSTVEQKFNQVLETQESAKFEYYYASCQVWMEVQLYPSAEGLSVYFRDISEQQAALRDRTYLLQSEQLLRAETDKIQRQLTTLFETSPVGMAFLDRQQRFVAINEALAEINGLSREQHLGSTMSDLFAESDPQVVQIFERIYSTGEPFISSQFAVNVPGRCDRTPGYYNVYYLPNITREGDVEGVVVYVLDVTDRVRLEQGQRFLAQASAVLASSLDYQTTLEQVAYLAVPNLADWCVVHVVEEDGSIAQLAVAHVNPAKIEESREMQQKYPLNPNEARGAAYTLRTGQSELIPEISDEMLVEAACDREHLEMLRGIGFHAVMTVAMKAQEKILGVISFVSAESRRRYEPLDLHFAEELAGRAALAIDNARLYRLAQHERAIAEGANRIKDEFLAVLSHELRTPLNPILGWSKLLRSRPFDPETANRALEIIERNAQLQTQLIEDLLDISRILQGKLSLNAKPVNLAATLEAALETVRLSAETKGIRIHTHLNAAVDTLVGDSGRLQQVIWNLLSNAIKFTPAGGVIEIELTQVENQAQIRVSDTGIGISPDFLPYIFEYFRQADSSTTRTFGGLGLGLAVAEHIVELHGGTIWAESLGEDCGATFMVRLPLRIESGSQDQPQLTPSANSEDFGSVLKGVRVLAVDDDPDMRELMFFILDQEGALVVVVESATDVLTTLPNIQPDILIADIGMPDVDGYSLLRQVRRLSSAQGGNIPAIALTAYVGEVDRQQSLNAGFQMHLAKPVEPDALVKAIANVLEK